LKTWGDKILNLLNNIRNKYLKNIKILWNFFSKII